MKLVKYDYILNAPYDVRFKLACDPETSENIQHELVEDKDSYVRAALAKYTNSPKVLENLYTDGNNQVRMNVANNIHAPNWVLLEYLTETYWICPSLILAVENNLLNNYELQEK